MMRRLLIPMVVVVVFAALALPASARVSFCSADPVYRVGDETVEVIVEIAPPESAESITDEDPVRVHLKAPLGTNPEVIDVNGPFPQDASFEVHDSKKLVVEVTVPDVEFKFVRVSVLRNGVLVYHKQSPTGRVTIQFNW